MFPVNVVTILFLSLSSDPCECVEERLPGTTLRLARPRDDPLLHIEQQSDDRRPLGARLRHSHQYRGGGDQHTADVRGRGVRQR